VADRMGGIERIESWARLFMLPGMGHCGGGPGPNQFDALPLMIDWVENGKAPDRIVARNPQSGRTRPVFPYPTVARYTGTGSTDDAASFEAAPPPVRHKGDLKWIWDPPNRRDRQAHTGRR
jgi:hypothetical protein